MMSKITQSQFPCTVGVAWIQTALDSKAMQIDPYDVNGQQSATGASTVADCWHQQIAGFGSRAAGQTTKN